MDFGSMTMVPVHAIFHTLFDEVTRNFIHTTSHWSRFDMIFLLAIFFVDDDLNFILIHFQPRDELIGLILAVSK